MYGKRNVYTVLKQGVWVNIIIDAFIKHFKMLCNYIYKQCRVSNMNDLTDAKYYIRFEGKCKYCSSKLVGWADEKPIESCPLCINILTKDTRNRWNEHLSKRPLNGS